MLLCVAPQTRAPVGRVGREAALEPAPGDALALSRSPMFWPLDRASEMMRVAGVRAVVEEGSGSSTSVPSPLRSASLTTPDWARPCRRSGRPRAVAVVARDQVERAGRRRAERGVEGVVVHREVLRVVPERGDGVAVEVVHDEARRATGEVGRAGLFLGELHELVHLATVEGLLLRRVAVVQVAGNACER